MHADEYFLPLNAHTSLRIVRWQRSPARVRGLSLRFLIIPQIITVLEREKAIHFAGADGGFAIAEHATKIPVFATAHVVDESLTAWHNPFRGTVVLLHCGWELLLPIAIYVSTIQADISPDGVEEPQ